MNKHRYVDISVGLFMVFGLGAFLVLALKVSGLSTWSSKTTYTVTANFVDIGGLKVQAPVTVAGVKIGEVTAINLQPGTLNAKVTMKLRGDKPIPFEETSARILTQGLLGSNYISIVPGFEDAGEKNHVYLQDGDQIAHTQEAIILENLVGQLIFNMNKK